MNPPIAVVNWSNGTFGTITRARFLGENRLLLEISQDVYRYSLRLTGQQNQFEGVWECNDPARSRDPARLTLEGDENGTYSFFGVWIEQGESMEWWADEVRIEHNDAD
jgi:hypothetical protein